MGWDGVKRRLPSKVVPFWASSKASRNKVIIDEKVPGPGKKRAPRY